MDRLNAQDLMMLWPEELGWSQDIGALAILDGRRLLDADGRFQIERAHDQIQARLHRVPRFRQLLHRPAFGLGWPLWIDAPSIDLAEHVRVFPLDPPADEAKLLLACEELRSPTTGSSTSPRWPTGNAARISRSLSKVYVAHWTYSRTRFVCPHQEGVE